MIFLLQVIVIVIVSMMLYCTRIGARYGGVHKSKDNYCRRPLRVHKRYNDVNMFCRRQLYKIGDTRAMFEVLYDEYVKLLCAEIDVMM
jgi:hypothetical protein